jgi:hypothetical protein
MSYLLKGLLLWGLAGMLAWFFYSIFINTKSKIGFIDSDRVAYRKAIATVVEKQVTQTEYELHFTYPEESNSFRSALSVSQEEFEQTQIGHKMPIFLWDSFSATLDSYQKRQGVLSLNSID